MFVLSCAPALADDEARRVKAIEMARPAVVSIRTHKQGRKEPGIGSGVIFRRDGFILTNHHVIDGADIVKVHLVDERHFTAQVLHLAPQHDLALLKIKGANLPTAKIGSSKRVKLGQSAIAIGDPLGFESSVTIGTVGGLNRSVEIRGVDYKSLIQTDAAINPGSSGGALVDLDGRVIGINTLVYTGPRKWKHARGLGFAISIDHAMKVANALLQRNPEKVTGKPWLGIKGDTVTRDVAENYGLTVRQGVLIRKVIVASPSADAGLRSGDVITRVDGDALVGLPDLSAILDGRRPGDTLEFDVLRDGKMQKIKVLLDVSSR